MYVRMEKWISILTEKLREFQLHRKGLSNNSTVYVNIRQMSYGIFKTLFSFFIFLKLSLSRELKRKLNFTIILNKSLLCGVKSPSNVTNHHKNHSIYH